MTQRQDAAGRGGFPGARATGGSPEPVLNLALTDTTTTARLDRESAGWRAAMAADLLAKGLQLATQGVVGGGGWHIKRSCSLQRGWQEKESRCGTRAAVMRHQDGWDVTVPQPCRSRVCKRCQGAQHRRRLARMRRAVEYHDRLQRRAGRRLRMLTLTLRHSAAASERVEALSCEPLQAVRQAALRNRRRVDAHQRKRLAPPLARVGVAAVPRGLCGFSSLVETRQRCQRRCRRCRSTGQRSRARDTQRKPQRGGLLEQVCGLLG